MSALERDIIGAVLVKGGAGSYPLEACTTATMAIEGTDK